MPSPVTGSPAEFSWRRLEAGYMWDEDTRLLPPDMDYFGEFGEYEGPWLVPLAPHGAEVEFNPIDTVGLYRDFAALDRSREWVGPDSPAEKYLEATAAFANRYGLLTRGTLIDTKRGLAYGETIEQWELEIFAVERQVFFWDLLRNYEENPGPLNRRLTRHEADEHNDCSWGFAYDRESALAGSYSHDVDPVAARHGRSRVALPASAVGVLGDSFEGLARGQLDAPSPEVKSHAENLLAYDLNRNFRDSTTAVQLVQDPLARKTKHVLSLQATTLVGAVYIQIAQEFLGGPQAMQCKCCGTWFHPIRKTRMYCSNRCRQRAARGAC